MDMIDASRLKMADELKPTLRPGVRERTVISDEKFESMLRELNNPVNAQKEMAVKVKVFLDARIEVELDDKGTLSDSTRKWVESYNSMLEKIQKALHGDKSVSLHLHKVSHGTISAKIRELG